MADVDDQENFAGWGTIEFEQDADGKLKQVAPAQTADSQADSPAATETGTAATTQTTDAGTDAGTGTGESEEERKKLSRTDRLKRQRDTLRTQNEALVQRLQAMEAERERLLATVGSTIATSAESQKRALEGKRTAAQQAFTDAFEKGDKDGVLRAQQAMIEAEIELKNVEATLAQAPRRTADGVDGGRSFDTSQQTGQQTLPRQTPTQPAPSQRTQDWIDDHPEFNTDPRFNGYMLGVHKSLVNAGIEPESDEYFAELTKEAEMFKGRGKAPAATDKQKKPPVAGASPTPKQNPNRIRLTKDDLDSARRMGVPPDVYARELLKLSASGWDPSSRENDYVTIS